MRGFLKSVDGVFLLGPRITTIGRKDCDLIIQDVVIDCQHAAIEYDEVENMFSLQDLNSTHGTFINDVWVRNAAVPLSPGDLIRFGHTRVLYEFIVDIPKEISPCLPAEKISLLRSAAAAQPASSPVIYTDGLPQLRSIKQLGEAGGLQPLVIGKEDLDAEDQPHWIVGPARSDNDMCLEAENLDTPPEQMEQLVQHLQDKVRELSALEGENIFKEDLLNQLRDEVAYLQARLRQFEVGSHEIISHDSLHPGASVKMLQLQTATAAAAAEAKDKQTRLTDSNGKMLPDEQASAPDAPAPDAPAPDAPAPEAQLSGLSMSASIPLSHELASACDGHGDVEVLKRELDTTRGIVRLLQKNLAEKDATMFGLVKEVEDLRLEADQKDVQIAAMTENILHSSEDVDLASKIIKMEKEVLVLQFKLKKATEQLEEQKAAAELTKNELHGLHKSTEADKLTLKKLHAENDQNKMKTVDLERAERLARIEIEQLNKRLERLRSRLIQTAFSSPNLKSPNTQISDDDLVAALRKSFDSDQSPKK